MYLLVWHHSHTIPERALTLQTSAIVCALLVNQVFVGTKTNANQPARSFHLSCRVWFGFSNDAVVFGFLARDDGRMSDQPTDLQQQQHNNNTTKHLASTTKRTVFYIYLQP